jgi:hypothetical protein
VDFSCNGRVHTSAGGCDTALYAAQGLVTLLILPIANAANQHLQSNDTYWKLNVAQVRFEHVMTALPVMLPCTSVTLIVSRAGPRQVLLHSHSTGGWPECTDQMQVPAAGGGAAAAVWLLRADVALGTRVGSVQPLHGRSGRPPGVGQ